MDNHLSFGEMNNTKPITPLLELDLQLLIPILEAILPLLLVNTNALEFGRRSDNRQHSFERNLPSFGVEEG